MTTLCAVQNIDIPSSAAKVQKDIITKLVATSENLKEMSR